MVRFQNFCVFSHFCVPSLFCEHSPLVHFPHIVPNVSKRPEMLLPTTPIPDYTYL